MRFIFLTFHDVSEKSVTALRHSRSKEGELEWNIIENGTFISVLCWFHGYGFKIYDTSQLFSAFSFIFILFEILFQLSCYYRYINLYFPI